MPNIQDPNFNKNVSMVYVEEHGFTGYKGLDFTKLDNLEDILQEGVVVSGFDVNLVTTNAVLSGIKNDTNSINANLVINNASLSGVQDDANSIDGKIFATGDAWPAGVQGTIVFQADLSSQFDNVDIAGYAGADISGIKEVLSNVLVTGLNIPNGLTVYQANLDKTLDNVSVSPIQSFSISNYLPSGGNGTILNANQNRLELFVQNLATGTLYVKYGISASNSSFNFALAGNSYENAGDGGSISDQAYTGDISVFSLTTPNYISWERS